MREIDEVAAGMLDGYVASRPEGQGPTFASAFSYIKDVHTAKGQHWSNYMSLSMREEVALSLRRMAMRALSIDERA